jgi:hypothetical protein
MLLALLLGLKGLLVESLKSGSSLTIQVPNKGISHFMMFNVKLDTKRHELFGPIDIFQVQYSRSVQLKKRSHQ